MIYPFDGETLGAPGTGTHENGVVAAGEQLVDIQVGPDSDIGMDVHAEGFLSSLSRDAPPPWEAGTPVCRTSARRPVPAPFRIYVDGKTLAGEVAGDGEILQDLNRSRPHDRGFSQE